MIQSKPLPTCSSGPSLCVIAVEVLIVILSKIKMHQDQKRQRIICVRKQNLDTNNAGTVLYDKIVDLS